METNSKNLLGPNGRLAPIDFAEVKKESFVRLNKLATAMFTRLEGMNHSTVYPLKEFREQLVHDEMMSNEDEDVFRWVLALAEKSQLVHVARGINGGIKRGPAPEPKVQKKAASLAAQKAVAEAEHAALLAKYEEITGKKAPTLTK